MKSDEEKSSLVAVTQALLKDHLIPLTNLLNSTAKSLNEGILESDSLAQIMSDILRRLDYLEQESSKVDNIWLPLSLIEDVDQKGKLPQMWLQQMIRRLQHHEQPSVKAKSHSLTQARRIFNQDRK